MIRLFILFQTVISLKYITVTDFPINLAIYFLHINRKYIDLFTNITINNIIAGNKEKNTHNVSVVSFIVTGSNEI